MAQPNITELVTMTLRNRRRKLADNVTNHNALLRRLNDRGNKQLEDGGRTLVEELEYAENSTFMYYSGYEVLDITPQTVFDAAEYNWKQAATVVSVSGLEKRQNSGRSQSINLVTRRLGNAEKTMMNNISTGVYSDGSGSSGKQIGGLQLLVSDDGTGTVGGIARASFSFWANQFYDFSANSVTASASTIQSAMHTLWLNCIRGADYPDLIVAGSTYFDYYWSSLTTIQRITDEQSAASGFRSLTFYGPGGSADVIYDSSCSATRMYFLNTDYLFYRCHQDADMEPLTDRESINQDATVMPIIFMGNLTMSNAARQGLLVA